MAAEAVDAKPVSVCVARIPLRQLGWRIMQAVALIVQ
jgi:hypothetical protein